MNDLKNTITKYALPKNRSKLMRHPNYKDDLPVGPPEDPQKLWEFLLTKTGSTNTIIQVAFQILQVVVV